MAWLTVAATASRWQRGHDAAALLPTGLGRRITRRGRVSSRVSPRKRRPPAPACPLKHSSTPVPAPARCALLFYRTTPPSPQRSNPEIQLYLPASPPSPPHHSPHHHLPCPYTAPPTRSSQREQHRSFLACADSPLLPVLPPSCITIPSLGPSSDRDCRKEQSTPPVPATPVLCYKSPPWTFPLPTPTNIWIFTDPPRP
jgi:hypothetical protein